MALYHTWPTHTSIYTILQTWRLPTSAIGSYFIEKLSWSTSKLELGKLQKRVVMMFTGLGYLSSEKMLQCLGGPQAKMCLRQYRHMKLYSSILYRLALMKSHETQDSSTKSFKILRDLRWRSPNLTRFWKDPRWTHLREQVGSATETSQSALWLFCDVLRLGSPNPSTGARCGP